MKALYFAYGSNMNIENMKKIAPTCKKLGRASIQGFRLRFTSLSPANEGICSMERSSFKDMIQGIIYEVDHSQLPRPFIGSETSLMDAILIDSGRFVTVLVYYSKNNHLAAPREDYLMEIHQSYISNQFNMRSLEDALNKETYPSLMEM